MTLAGNGSTERLRSRSNTAGSANSTLLMSPSSRPAAAESLCAHAHGHPHGSMSTSHTRVVLEGGAAGSSGGGQLVVESTVAVVTQSAGESSAGTYEGGLKPMV